jgi:hypothetical protein
MQKNTLSTKELKIIGKLRELAEQAKNQAGGAKFTKSVNTLADRLKDRIQASAPSKYDTNLQATLKALETWVNQPSKYARSVALDGNKDVVRLDPKTYKCNRFISDTFTESGAARGYFHDNGEKPSESNQFSYPTSGSNPFSHYPISANDLYDRDQGPNMSSIDSRKAKIGDIVAFPSRDETNSAFSAHVGIYLGDGLYISAHETESRFGKQVSDGVEISPVDWSKNPRFKRFQGENQIYGTFSNVPDKKEILNAQNLQQSKKNSLVGNETSAERSTVTNSGVLNSSENQNLTAQEINPRTDVSKINTIKPNANVSEVVASLQNNAAEVKKEYGLDVTTAEGMGKAVMQYWKENNLDPKELRVQLPDIKDSEFETAFKAATNNNATQSTKSDQRSL